MTDTAPADGDPSHSPDTEPGAGLVASLFAEILEAARDTDTLTRQPDSNGAYMEFALLPDRLALDLEISADSDGRLRLPGRSHPAAGTLSIRWRRLATPEAVRAEIDDVNEIDGLIRIHNRQADLERRYRTLTDPEHEENHDDQDRHADT